MLGPGDPYSGHSGGHWWDPWAICPFNRNQGNRDFEFRWEEFERRPCDQYEEGEFVKRDRSPLHRRRSDTLSLFDRTRDQSQFEYRDR
jgi:hypothetical protein